MLFQIGRPDYDESAGDVYIWECNLRFAGPSHDDDWMGRQSGLQLFVIELMADHHHQRANWHSDAD